MSKKLIDKPNLFLRVTILGLIASECEESAEAIKRTIDDMLELRLKDQDNKTTGEIDAALIGLLNAGNGLAGALVNVRIARENIEKIAKDVYGLNEEDST